MNDIDVRIFYPELYPSADPPGMLIRDPYRLPEYENRGEIIAINARAYETWQKQDKDLVKDNKWWDIIVDPKKYATYNAEPAYPGSNLAKPTPVDLALMSPQRLLLHEVRCLFPS